MLSVNATVDSGCEVLVPKPFVLTMSYAPLLDMPTLGTSSFAYICTSGTSVSVTPTSSNCASSSSSSSSSSCIGPNWEAISTMVLTLQQQPPPLTYTLWNNTTCSNASSSSSSSQLSNGVTEQLGTATGLKTIYNICGIPNNGQQRVPAGTYTDQVTFTFNLLQTSPPGK